MSWWVEESTGDAVNCTRSEDQALHFLCLWAGLGGRVFYFIFNPKELLHTLYKTKKIKNIICSCEHRYVDFFHDNCQ